MNIITVTHTHIYILYIYRNDKEIKPSYQDSEFHVNMCYNLEPVHNELMLCVQWTSIVFQTGSARCSGPTPH